MMDTEEKILIKYNNIRAIYAIALPIFAISIPIVNFAVNRQDFIDRYTGKPLGVLAITIGLVWFIYSLWPSAFRRLGNGESAAIKNGELIAPDGRSFHLARLKQVRLVHPTLRNGLVVVEFAGPYESVELDCAFQAFGVKKKPEEIADAIRDQVNLYRSRDEQRAVGV